jgi:hypothetical protein
MFFPASSTTGRCALASAALPEGWAEMRTIAYYEALIAERRVTSDESARRRDAARLAEIAHNLASLDELVRAEAPPGEPEARTEAVLGTNGGTSK